MPLYVHALYEYLYRINIKKIYYTVTSGANCLITYEGIKVMSNNNVIFDSTVMQFSDIFDIIKDILQKGAKFD